MPNRELMATNHFLNKIPHKEPILDLTSLNLREVA